MSLALTGCGSGGTPVAPATPPSQPGLMTRGPYLQHADDGVASDSIAASVELGPDMRELLAPFYAANGVDLVFGGHDHFYERTHPIGGVSYVTTGAGGAELYS